MQGLAEGKCQEDAAGKPYAVALITRRSSMHPGMRYIARGLNALASPGNEAEVEQIMWTRPTGENLYFSRMLGRPVYLEPSSQVVRAGQI